MYDLIYADPPWRYSFSKSKSRDIENHYPTMTLDEICVLDIPANKNSVLYLWTTAPKMIEGLKVMDAWGFKYKSQAIWDKVNVGMGYWFRGRHEILLVGTRGKFSPPPQGLRCPSVIESKRGRHSKKPEVVRELIESWFPEAKKLEMFCRYPTVGWDAFGNEVENSITI